MPQLGHFEDTIIDASGNAIVSASVTLYREGATVNGAQSGASGLSVLVRHKGKIASGDTVFIGTATTLTYTATVVDSTHIQLSGSAVSVANGDRIIASNNLPTLYSDDQGAVTKANPLTSSSSGFADAHMEYGSYEEIISGAGLTTTLKQARITPTEAVGQARIADSFARGSSTGGIQEAINDLPSTGGEVRLSGNTTYNTSMAITVTSDVMIRGAGPSSIVKLSSAANSNVFTVTAGSSRVTFMNFQIDGNRANNSGVIYGILATSVTDLWVSDMLITSAYVDGIRLATTATRATIQGCYFTDCGSDSMYVVGGLGVRVCGNHMSSWGNVVAAAECIGLSAPASTVICGNTIVQGVSTSFAIQSVGAVSQVNVCCNNIDGNSVGGGISLPNSKYSSYRGNTIINGKKGTGSLIEVGGSTAEEVSIDGNVIVDGGIAVAGGTNCIIRGNVIKISVGSAFTPLSVGGANAATNFVVAGNVIDGGGDANNAQISLGNYGSKAALVNVLITGNVLRNQQSGYAVRLEPAAGSTGVVISSNTITGAGIYGIRTNADTNSTNVTISYNDLRGNTAGAITHLATGGIFRFFQNIPDDGTLQSITAVGNAITANSVRCPLSANGVYTLTSAPTIADGYNGQEVELINVGANAITIQDQGTLANTNLRLMTATVVLATRQNVRLRFDTTVNDWVQTSPLASVI